MANPKQRAQWLDQALRDPASVFDSPDAVSLSAELTQDEKIRILRSWAYDASEMSVAEEEGMGGRGEGVLQQILQVLAELTKHQPSPDIAPTKQHGPF